MKTKLTLAVGMVAAATMAFAPPAAAAEREVCLGSENLGYVCVDPTGRRLIEDCVYIVAPECVPVAVDGPSIQLCITEPNPC